MKLKQYIGIALIAGLFIGIYIHGGITTSFMTISLIFGGVALLLVFIAFALSLIEDN